jgi:hypothetical protein
LSLDILFRELVLLVNTLQSFPSRNSQYSLLIQYIQYSTYVPTSTYGKAIISSSVCGHLFSSNIHSVGRIVTFIQSLKSEQTPD